MAARCIINAFTPLFSNPEADFSKLGSDVLYMPRFPKSIISDLLKTALYLFINEDTILNIKGDFTLVGDLHGNIRDLMRILSQSGNPFLCPYLFLGDYVDRGDFSVEVIILLLAFKIAYPENVYLIRGNHEFAEINRNYGFYDQCMRLYDEDIYNKFNEVFNYLPLGAIVNENSFVVHGGIGPSFTAVSELQNIMRPIINFKNGRLAPIIQDLMWSDPQENVGGYCKSTRGFGQIFGADALKHFLISSKLKHLIRAHQCVYNGVEKQFHGKIFTVFSSSSYSSIANKAGILKFNNDLILSYNFAPIPQLKTDDVKYKDFIAVNEKPYCTRTRIYSSARKTIRAQKNSSDDMIRASFTQPQLRKLSIRPRVTSTDPIHREPKPLKTISTVPRNLPRLPLKTPSPKPPKPIQLEEEDKNDSSIPIPEY